MEEIGVEQQEAKRRLCLIVDDSLVVRRIARGILLGLELNVDEAGNGKIALEMCESMTPDLVLLDWNMPVMSGIDFLRAYREKYGVESAKVIFCTTQGDVQHIRDAAEAGANDYIIKPFDANTLRKKVEAVLGIARPDSTISNN